LRIHDRRIARIIRACQELPGQELTQYIDDAGNPQDVTSSDVNSYLRGSRARILPRRTFAPGLGPCLPRWL
jgi:DNA topoisomerase-1